MKKYRRSCDWCNRRAIIRTYRTLYAGSEYESTSLYYECDKCYRIPSDEITTIYHPPEKHGFLRRIVERGKLLWRSMTLPFIL